MEDYKQHLSLAMLSNPKKPIFMHINYFVSFLLVFQRLRTCQEYIDHEGITQQSLVINTPKYPKRYILPGNDIFLSWIIDSSIVYLPHLMCIHFEKEDEQILTVSLDSCSVGETMRGANRTKLKYQGCSLDDEDDWHQFRNGSMFTFLFDFFVFACYFGDTLP